MCGLEMSASVDRWLEGNASDLTALKARPMELICKAGIRDFSVNTWGLYTLTQKQKRGLEKIFHFDSNLSFEMRPLLP